MTVSRRALVALLAGACLAPLPRPAGGHAYLVRSVPARRARLYRSPPRVQLWFNERLEPPFSRAEVANDRGVRVDLQDARVGPEDPRSLSVGLPELPPGVYTIRFRVVSVDGHVVDGELPFTLARTRQP